MNEEKLKQILEKSTKHHRHLCPRQVLGARMGLLAGQVLALELPQAHDCKRLFIITETDGCGADGISHAVNCWIGRRTMRVEDYGKLAATFIDTQTGTAVRIVPRPHIRQLALEYAPEANNKWEAMLLGYQRIPDLDLLAVQPVILRTPIEQILSRPGRKAICQMCGEEIMNEREIVRGDRILCRSCAGDSYDDEKHDFRHLLKLPKFSYNAV